MSELWVFASSAGTFAAWPTGLRPDRVPLDLARDEQPVAPVQADPADELLAFTADGTAFPVRVGDLPVVRTIVRGARPVPLPRGGRLAALAHPRPAGGYLLFATAGGEVKRCEARSLGAIPEEGGPAYDVPEGDRLIAVVPHGPGDDAILQARGGKALRLELDAIRPVKTASAGGVAGMRLERGDEVVAATRAADGELLLVLHRRGAGKAVPVADYPRKGRGTGGVVSASPDTPRRSPAGPIHAACAAAADAEVLVVTSAGALLRTRPGAGEPATRATVSRQVARTDAGHEVVAALRVP
jgi:DNA gyrase subunit A